MGKLRFDQQTCEEVLQHFGHSPDSLKGYTQVEVEEKQKECGFNELEKEDPTPLWQLVVEQFDDTLVKILLAAAFVSFLLAFFERQDAEKAQESGVTAYVEPIVILVILILNAIVGVWQESNAEAALEALKDLQPENARVLRDEKWQTLPARILVPGDIVEVRVGDKIPADMRLISLSTTSMRIEQAQMTGESTSVSKDLDPLGVDSENLIQAKTNCLFATTIVVNGVGRGVVTAIGMQTEIGQIQASVQEAAQDDETTPLKKKLDEFGELLSKVIGVICLVVWLINYKNFFDPAHGSVFKGCIYYFKIAVALAVAAIPEGLPAVITTCLALGTRKMAAKNAIVRKLPSVETLGCTTVICSDKTGTLTTNEMSVTRFVTFDNSLNSLQEYQVDGVSYAPVGKVSPQPSSQNQSVELLCRICSLCNESNIEVNDQYDETKNQATCSKYVRIGEPTEAALRVVVEKIATITHSSVVKNSEQADFYNQKLYNGKYEKLATLEFARDRKSMSVLVQEKNGAADKRQTRSSSAGVGNNELLVKGAPEQLLSRCRYVKLSDGSSVKLTDEGRERIGRQINEMATNSLRCLAMAIRESDNCTDEISNYNGDRHHPAHSYFSNQSNFKTIEDNLTFVGLCGMLDPPRPQVKPMIEKCRLAGIRVIMITGDNKLTAESIAREIGILSNDQSILSSRSFTGTEFFSLPQSKQLSLLSHKCNEMYGLVFSRTEPKHKQLLVKMLKNLGEVTAMTGDGVNDAPALKQADIGIAMGIAGTEVAKEACDMVLADDNFATIVSAVEEGRAIYNNMQAFIRYLISSNIGEVAAIFFTAALGLPEGLIPVQLLWVNLVTDGPPATALGFNPPDEDIMTKPPRKSDDVLINGWVFFRYMVVGIYVGLACVGVFAYWYMYYEASGDGHTLISFYELTHWSKCTIENWPVTRNFTVANFDGMKFNTPELACSYFTDGKKSASTLSLSVLVTIEMLNALNALSEDGSLLTMPPWANPYLLLAMVVSFGMHFVILYVEPLAEVFFVTPLDFNEWMVVLAFSFPVILIDEVLKYVGRCLNERALKKRLGGDDQDDKKTK